MGRIQPADPRMRQATVNVLADMGALPTTIAADLTAATKVDRHRGADPRHHPPTYSVMAPVPWSRSRAPRQTLAAAVSRESRCPSTAARRATRPRARALHLHRCC